VLEDTYYCNVSLLKLVFRKNVTNIEIGSNIKRWKDVSFDDVALLGPVQLLAGIAFWQLLCIADCVNLHVWCGSLSFRFNVILKNIMIQRSQNESHHMPPTGLGFLVQYHTYYYFINMRKKN
jgi:hypothetical protein